MSCSCSCACEPGENCECDPQPECVPSTNAPVQYFNGEIRMSTTDVGSSASGLFHGRSYNNRLSEMYSGPNGNNWVMPDQPYALKLTDDSYSVVFGASPLWFDRDGEGELTFTARYGAASKYTLTESPDDGLLIVEKQVGDGLDTYEFNDFTQQEKPQGFFSRRIDSSGFVTFVPDGAYGTYWITEIRRVVGNVTWSIQYDLYEPGTNGYRIEYATLRKLVDGDVDWTEIRRAYYTYYGADDDQGFGSANDLELVVVQVPDSSEAGGWRDVSKTYYRWYVMGDENGFVGGLKYVVNPTGFAEMLADGYDPLSVADTVLADYADHYFEYDSDRRVTKEIAQNCSSCGGGGGTGALGDSLLREENPSQPTSYNQWRWKVIETLANGNTKTVYTNWIGQVIFTILQEADTSNQWYNYQKYGESGYDDGKVVLKATSAAIAGFDDAEDDLDVSLKSSEGLITVNTYYTSTDASGETLGGVKGYLKEVAIKGGSSGTEIKQKTLKYKTSTNTFGQLSYEIGEQTVYSDDAGTDAITTGYSYEWYLPTGGDTPYVKQKTTTLPVVPSSQNGDGSTVTSKEYYDVDGRNTWSMDERGIITERVFDVDTGLLLKEVLDVGPVVDGPSGWSATAGDHENVTTDYTYDDLGRPIQTLGPVFDADLGGSSATEVRSASWVVYVEAVSQDQTWSAQGYQKTSDQSFELVNPVSINFSDKAGRPIDQIQSKRSTGSGKLESTDTFLRADWTRWSVNAYDLNGQKVYERVYHLIPEQVPDLGLDGVDSDPGDKDDNYNEVYFGYDDQTNLKIREVDQMGTITRTVYDGINRVSSVWVGTNDVPEDGDWMEWSPASNDGTANMVKVSESQYDDGAAGGNSNLTKSIQYVDSNTTRETEYDYDFRNRQVSTSGEEGFYQEVTYDNLSRQTKTERYVGSSAGNLVSRDESDYDNRGRVYETRTYEVDPDTGAVGNHLTGQSWYDATGNQVKSIAPEVGEVWSQIEYDNLGRGVRSWTGYDDTSAPSDELVVTDIEIVFDKASHVLYSEMQERDTDASVSSPTFRTSYSASWFDGAGRSIGTANYGALSSFSYPSVTPSRSDTVLVSSVAYDDAGMAYESTDPMGIVTHQVFDAMGRVTSLIENYVTSGGTGGDDENRTTETTYTANSQIATLTAKMTPGSSPTNDQVTTYVYGVTISGGSDLESNSLLFATQYPEDSTTSRVEVNYNRLGQPIEQKDQAGTTHVLEYDGLGRKVTDKVTAFGANIDQSIKRMTAAYDDRGAVSLITSHSATTGTSDEVNQVQLAYNGFGQLITDYQEHDGTVNTSSSLKVQYGYDDGSSSSNEIRPTSLTYPSGRQIDYGYGTSGSLDDKLNRIQSIKDGSTTLASYQYLGVGTPVVVDYLEPGVQLDLWGGTAGSYTGLDQFGRVIDLKWLETTGSTELVQLKYGYNRNGSPLYRRDEVARANSADYDELYGYDGLNRLNDMRRGQLNTSNTAISGMPTAQQTWGLDQVGNWDTFDVSANGTPTLNQTRTNNKVNEITGISESSGQAAWVDPAYDVAGNTTEFPQIADPTSTYAGTYDAWNRLVKVESVTGGSSTTVAEYAYDGRTYRIQKKLYDGSGVLDKTLDVYFTSNWQAIEQTETPSSGSASFERQWVWGQRYVDDLICRDQGSTGSSALNGRVYSLTDRMFNVVALINASGTVQERFAYHPYGQSIILTPTFSIRSSSDYDWEVRFQGLFLDDETGLIYQRNRMNHPLLGRFMQRDPLGYVDGMSLYAGYFVMKNGLDLLGLESGDCFYVTHDVGIGGFRKNSIVGKPEPKSQGINKFSGKGSSLGVYGEGTIELTGEVCEVCCPGGDKEGYAVNGSALAALHIGASLASSAFKAEASFTWRKWTVSGGVSAWYGARVYGHVYGKAGVEIGYNTCSSDPHLHMKFIVGGELGLEFGGEATVYAALSYSWVSISKRLSIGLAGGGRLGIEWDIGLDCDCKRCYVGGPVTAYLQGYIRGVFLGFNMEVGITGKKSLGNMGISIPNGGFLPGC